MSEQQQRRVVIVGVGALGSHLALFARNLPARLTLVDGDRVERKNVLSQFHTKMALGRNKAQALQQALQGLYEVRVDAVPHRLVPDNAATLLGAADVLVDCVDNAPTRKLMQEFARAHGKACLHGALSADGEYARIMWDAAFTIDQGGDGQATCEDGEHLPFIVRAAAQMAATLQQFLRTGTQVSCHLHAAGMIEIATADAVG